MFFYKKIKIVNSTLQNTTEIVNSTLQNDVI